MMPSSIVLYRIANPEQGTHSNSRCVCFRAWNDGFTGDGQALI